MSYRKAVNACDVGHIRHRSLAASPVASHTPSMEPAEFKFTDDHLEAWLDGRGARGDSNLTRFIVDLRLEVESYPEEPSPKLASWIADSSRCRRSDAPLRARVTELDDIIELLAHARS